VFLPRNLPHASRSVGGPVTELLILTPGGLDGYFAELHAAMRSNVDPVRDTQPPPTPASPCRARRLVDLIQACL
jgi:hypothetical protein